VGGNGRRVGVLALQGDFEAHARALAAHHVAAVEVRTPDDLAGVAGLVLPGGESTTMWTLMKEDGLAERLVEVVRGGLPVLATCAGVILAAREVRSPEQPSLNLLDAVVERNAYGRQVDSAVVSLAVCAPEELGAREMEGVFIRAPRVLEVGPEVRVLARRGQDPVLVRQDSLLAATFHPELSPASPVIDLFVRGLRSTT
jgi:pyridoxal 5'-phosphate synthase pdxT subunit